MLRRYVSESKSYDFVEPSATQSSRHNTFTVIVGKNGTGKSRLLRAVVTHLIDGVVERTSLLRDERMSLVRDPGSSLIVEHDPSRIICVSTSPFDKFPILRRDHINDGYSYLGLRGLPSMNLGLAYMSRIIYTLIDAADQSLEQAQSVAEVLDYLGYEGVINVELQLPPSRFLEDLLAASNAENVLDEYLNRPPIFSSDGIGALRQLRAMGSHRLHEVLEAAKRCVPAIKHGRVILSVSSNGVDIAMKSGADRADVLLIARSGLMRLRDVVLTKRGLGRPLKLQEASSGEQAVVMGLLGIGSQMRDGALICIDEPEVCLHPEWQEKYIQLLFYTFSKFRGCHFLIATHSPQIVAQIPEGSCYVMSMEDGRAVNAREYANRSIDFQLAEVFNAPGYRNEYLSRVALNVFAKASKAKKFDQQSLHELATLRKVFDDLRTNDPLRDLVIALNEMAKKYA